MSKKEINLSYVPVGPENWWVAYEIQQAEWPNYPDWRVYAGRGGFEPRNCDFLVTRDGRVVGIVGVTSAEGEDSAWLDWFTVVPGERRRGIGKQILQDMIDFCQRVGFKYLRVDTLDDLKLPASRLYDRIMDLREVYTAEEGWREAIYTKGLGVVATYWKNRYLGLGEYYERLRAEAAKLDTRNLVDRLKGMTNEEIQARLERERKELLERMAGQRSRGEVESGDTVEMGEWLEVAIENVEHDFNAGTVVRNANNFNVSRVHIVGRRKYNRRGAMCTDKYLNIFYWESVQDFLNDQRNRGRSVVAIENNVPGVQPLLSKKFVQGTTLVLGSEGEGISAEMLSGVDEVREIEGFGSTRSVNVGVASGIAMYEWVRQVVLEKGDCEGGGYNPMMGGGAEVAMEGDGGGVRNVESRKIESATEYKNYTNDGNLNKKQG